MPMDRSLYPDNWESFSLKIRKERALDRCECEGECGRDHGGRCAGLNGQMKMSFQRFGLVLLTRTVLTTAHLWRHGCTCHPAKCAIESHVKALCQACHLRYDLPHHVEHARATRKLRKDSARPLIVEESRD